MHPAADPMELRDDGDTRTGVQNTPDDRQVCLSSDVMLTTRESNPEP